MESSSSADSTDTDQRKKNKKFKKSYIQNYKKEWESNPLFNAWLQPSQRGNQYFHCKVCNDDCLGGIGAIKKHASTRKHSSKSTAASMQVSVFDMPSVSRNVSVECHAKQLEINIASFIAEHNLPFRTTDHLVQLIKKAANDPDACKKITCNRTKCAALINNVLGATSFDTLVSMLRRTKFSLLVDESTDCSSIKHLAIVCRVVGDNMCVQDNFLGLLPIADATATNIYKTIKDFFVENKIPYKDNLIGLAADGAHSMMGEHHSLKTLLKGDIPHLFVLKCICHSLALCSSYACEKIPKEIEDFVRNVYTYMAYSYKRQMEFKSFQDFADVKPHKLLHPSQTRWLSLLSVIKRVLEQYNALKLYFRTQYVEDGLLQSEKIYNQLENPCTKLYLEFLNYILPLFINLNIEFQSETPCIHLIYSRITTTYKTLLECYIKPEYLRNTDISLLQFRNPRYFLNLEDIYYGPVLMNIFLSEDISELQKKNLRIKCLDFYVEAAFQLYKRFPLNTDFVKSLKNLNFLDPINKDDITSLAPVVAAFPYAVHDINALDREWRLLRNSSFNQDCDMAAYWKNVLFVKRGDKLPMYPNLIQLVKYILCLPHSSAAVERIFSVINLNKTKIRNRLDTNSLTGILHTKRLLDSEPCYNLTVTTEMLSKHNNNIYK